MKDTDRDQEDPGAAARPAWVDEQAEGAGGGGSGGSPKFRERYHHVPVPGKHGEDGLWLHVPETCGLVAVLTWITAIAIPHSVATWMISTIAAVATAVIWYTAYSLTNSPSMSGYLGAWGICLTGWLTAARYTSPWRGTVIFALLLPVIVLAPVGVTVIRRFRERVNRVAETGRDNANVRECRYWEGLLGRLNVPRVIVRDIIRVEGGYQVHCRHGKAVDGHAVLTPDSVRELAMRIAVHKRLPKGAVYIEEEPAGGTAADFIVHVRSATGPRLTRYLPAENSVLSINRPFGLGILDTGKEFLLKLREVVVFICGVRGSGKSTLLNVFIAQLARCPDALIFMIDLKGGQEARAWLMPWLQGITKRPVIDWLATTREEAKIMLDALWEGGQARAESGRYGRKLRPGVYENEMCPGVVVICDETAVMTGHFIREDNISNTQLATRLLQIAETFRSVAIDPVVAAVRAVVDVTGNSGLKAMSEVRIGMRVSNIGEGQAIFPDNYAAAKQLAALKDKGSGIPKVGSELYPPVHFYNITDGNPDDDGHPTEDRITPIVLSVDGRRPAPEKLFADAMGEAYAKRWEQPHIKSLLAAWKAGAGIQDRAPAPVPAGQAQPAGGEDQHEEAPPESFEEMWRNDPLLASLTDMGDAGGLDDDEPGYQLNPVRVRMYHLLIERGQLGYTAGILWNQLQNEGLTVARQTVHEWLAQAEKQGYVCRTGKPQSGKARWVWRLPEGQEFDIPGFS